MTIRCSTPCARTSGFGALAALIVAAIAAPPAEAASAQVATRAFAQDGSFSGSQTTGGAAATLPLIDSTAAVSGGDSLAFSYAQSNALDGSLHADALASVSDDLYMVGRNSAATAAAGFTGTIMLGSAPLPPGIATFTVMIEGSYNFGTASNSFANSANMSYSALIGDVSYGQMIDFDPSTHAGLIGIPLTFSMTVTPGESIYASFLLQIGAGSVAGMAEVQMQNTMKLTSISLPPGYTYTSDSDGFLSQFASPVPEPATAAMSGLGLAGLLGWRRRASRALQARR